MQGFAFRKEMYSLKMQWEEYLPCIKFSVATLTFLYEPIFCGKNTWTSAETNRSV